MYTFNIIFCIVLIVGLSKCLHLDRYNRRADESPRNLTSQLNKFSINRGTDNENKVQIKVYYETLCPASVEFFRTQLRPLMEKLGPYLQVNLIPYGHARTSLVNGRYKFTCQHGPEECFGNKLHACVIDSLRNSTQAVLVNACIIQYYTGESDFTSVLNWCTYINNIKAYGVRSCVNSQRGRQLLKMYGDQTHDVKPHYVPYIVIEGTKHTQKQVERNLMEEVCRILTSQPAQCDRLKKRSYSRF